MRHIAKHIASNLLIFSVPVPSRLVWAVFNYGSIGISGIRGGGVDDSGILGPSVSFWT